MEEHGHELRRPIADYLGNGIYELRVSFHGIHYRILYFFHGKMAVVLSHGLIKEQRIPTKEIQYAVERKVKFENHPELHSYEEEKS